MLANLCAAARPLLISRSIDQRDMKHSSAILAWNHDCDVVSCSDSVAVLHITLVNASVDEQ